MSVYGVQLYDSSDNTFETCKFRDNEIGCYLINSFRNAFRFCNFSDNKVVGLNVSNSYDNIIYYNTFFNNSVQAWDDSINHWNSTEIGNYWSDYTEKYPEATDSDNNGVWDTPYEIPGNSNKDYYPLVNPPV
jgi:parallel beta-helix repeat protein